MISIIIPHRKGESYGITEKTLAMQTFQDFELIPVEDVDGRGANWARNRGAEQAVGDFMLFSDADIYWYSNALEVMYKWLVATPEASYCYGSYEMGAKIYCNKEFDAEALRRQNYISTMSLIRPEAFPWFDEDLRRLQDYALWLKMLKQGRTGVYCRRLLFSTAVRDGITYGPGVIPYDEALKIVHERYL